MIKMKKLTKGKEFNHLSTNEAKEIYGGNAVGTLFCFAALIAMEPQACGYPVDNGLMKDMIDCERVQH
jgi:hypothetical protein